MRKLAFITLLLVAVSVAAQEPTELYDCVDDADGPDFCTSDSTVTFLDASCDATFNRYRGRIAWPVLRNVGPVTISVKTRAVYRTIPSLLLPLYIEVTARTLPGDQETCRTGLTGRLILVAHGTRECGGTWESLGPVRLEALGVPLGALYTLQAVFFESAPNENGYSSFHTIGFSCIRVTSHPTALAPATWSAIKVLYR